MIASDARPPSATSLRAPAIPKRPTASLEFFSILESTPTAVTCAI